MAIPEVSISLEWFSDPLVILAMILAGAIIFILIVLFVLRAILTAKYRKKRAFDNILLLVMLPQMASEQKAGQATGSDGLTIQQLQEKIAAMENFFVTVAALKSEKGMAAWFRGRKDLLSAELIVHQDKISFYISCPINLKELIQEQIVAQFNDAVIEEVVDYNIFSPDSVVVGKLMKFKRQHCFPIKTYKKIEGDPLRALINAMGQVEENDGAAIQIVFRSARPSWHSLGTKLASKMQQGYKLEEAMKEVKGGVLNVMGREFWKLLKAAGSSSNKENSGGDDHKHHQLSPMEQEIVKGLEEKTSKPGVEANIRILATSKSKEKSETYLRNIVNAFAQFNIYQYGNSLEIFGGKLKDVVDDFIYRDMDEKSKMVLNSEEIASLFHFPLPSINTHPKIKWLEARQASAPLDLSDEGIVLGENHYRGVKRVVRINPKDRRRHIYLIGKTGSGKSYMMTNWMLQDLRNGAGMCVMDPHGELADDIIKYVPKERAEDVIYFDPSDIDRPIGLNLLEFDKPEQKTFVINELMNIFDKLYDLRSTGGPMFEQYFRNAAQLIMEDPESGSTLLEISRVMSDEDFRYYKLSKCKNPTVKDFWEKEAQKAGGEASLANMVPYITSKMTQFVANDYLRPIISQQKSGFNFREAMDSQKIILCNLSKGKIGEMNSDLLGMVIVGKILGAALSRVDTPEADRKDFLLFIDEFQNYLTEGISIILSEARKYKLNLHIAHQFIGQLVKNNDTRIRDSIFGNVGTIMSFRVGVDDAELFSKQYAPIFSEYDVMNVPKNNVFVKLLVNNQNPPAFNMFIPPRAKPEHPEIAEAIKELSRLKYGRDRDIIEAEIEERTQVEY
jgi:hypothetical protein